MRREEIIRTIKKTLIKHHVKEAFLFGSFARKEKNYHDIDVAITPPEKFSLMDMAGVLIELEEGTEGKVDLISSRALHPGFKTRILRDMVALL